MVVLSALVRAVQVLAFIGGFVLMVISVYDELQVEPRGLALVGYALWMWGVGVFFLGSLLIIGQLLLLLRRHERLRPSVRVVSPYPGREIRLDVHTYHADAVYSAVAHVQMETNGKAILSTPELNAFTLPWVEHSEAGFHINQGDVKQLRLSEHTRDTTINDHSMTFFRYTSEKIERTEFANVHETQAANMVVDVTVWITSRPDLKGRRRWDFKLRYIQPYPRGLVLIPSPTTPKPWEKLQHFIRLRRGGSALP